MTAQAPKMLRAVTSAMIGAISLGSDRRTRENPNVAARIVIAAPTGIRIGSGSRTRTSPEKGSFRERSWLKIFLFPHVPGLELALEVVPAHFRVPLRFFRRAPTEEQDGNDGPQ